ATAATFTTAAVTGATAAFAATTAAPLRRVTGCLPLCLNVDAGAVLNFVLAFEDDHFACLKPGPDRHVVTLCVFDRDHSQFGGLVLVHDIYEGALRSALHGRCGNHDGVLQSVNQQPDVHELVRIEAVIFVIENGFELRCLGCRIDLV